MVDNYLPEDLFNLIFYESENFGKLILSKTCKFGYKLYSDHWFNKIETDFPKYSHFMILLWNKISYVKCNFITESHVDILSLVSKLLIGTENDETSLMIYFENIMSEIKELPANDFLRLCRYVTCSIESFHKFLEMRHESIENRRGCCKCGETVSNIYFYYCSDCAPYNLDPLSMKKHIEANNILTMYARIPFGNGDLIATFLTKDMDSVLTGDYILYQGNCIGKINENGVIQSCDDFKLQIVQN
jgi:hypothetical protein